MIENFNRYIKASAETTYPDKIIQLVATKITNNILFVARDAGAIFNGNSVDTFLIDKNANIVLYDTSLAKEEKRKLENVMDTTAYLLWFSEKHGLYNTN